MKKKFTAPRLVPEASLAEITRLFLLVSGEQEPVPL